MSELKIVDFIFIFISIYFLILNLKLGYSMMLYVIYHTKKQRKF